MRIKSIVALSFAGAAAAAVIAGGAAYASGDPNTEPQVRIVYEEGNESAPGGAAYDCPEKNGGGQDGGGQSGESGQQAGEQEAL